MQKADLLKPAHSFNWRWINRGKVIFSISVRTEPGRVILSYKHRIDSGKYENHSYHVSIDWTSCHIGGERPWFTCPVINCGKRVAILYSGSIFACRHCFQLTYLSQKENIDDRATRGAENIRKKLGWMPGFLNGSGGRPKGMHKRTYQRLVKSHDNYVAISKAEFFTRFGQLEESFEDWI